MYHTHTSVEDTVHRPSTLVDEEVELEKMLLNFDHKSLFVISCNVYYLCLQ